jgi:hypothetical protein
VTNILAFTDERGNLVGVMVFFPDGDGNFKAVATYGLELSAFVNDEDWVCDDSFHVYTGDEVSDVPYNG